MTEQDTAVQYEGARPSTNLQTTAAIRIVIADDHPIFRDGLRRLLSLEQDFEVVGEAGEGNQVLDLVQQINPDILLLDLRMPGRDGFSVLQHLKYSGNKTRVIVLTASEDKNEFVQAMKFGCAGIVLKQTATDLLYKSIRKVYAGEIWHRPPRPSCGSLPHPPRASPDRTGMPVSAAL